MSAVVVEPLVQDEIAFGMLQHFCKLCFCYGYCWLALEPDFSLALFPCPCRLSAWRFLVQFVSQSVKLFGCSSFELEHFALEHFVWVL